MYDAKKTPMEMSSMGVFGKLVGARGFEPPASASRTQRSSQTEPRPVCLQTLFNITHIPRKTNRHLEKT